MKETKENETEEEEKQNKKKKNTLIGVKHINIKKVYFIE